MTKSLHSIAKTLVPPTQAIPDVSISGIKLNSSQVIKGDLFIAMSGSIVDGHDFIHDAIGLEVKEIDLQEKWKEQEEMDNHSRKEDDLSIIKIPPFYNGFSRFLPVSMEQ